MKRRRLGGIRISIVALLNGVDNGCECNVVSSVGEGSAMNFTLQRLRRKYATMRQVDYNTFLAPRMVIRYGYRVDESKRNHYLTQNAPEHAHLTSSKDS